MRWKSKLILRESLFTAVAFTFATYSYYITSFWGIQDHFMDSPLKEYMSGPFVHIELLFVSIIFGVLIGVINRVLDTPGLRRKPAIYMVFYRTVLYVLSLSVIIALLMQFFVWFIFSKERIQSMFDAITPKYSISFIFFIILVVACINFMLEIERIIGPKNIWRIILGMYKRPREETRIFLFMDLKGSTTLAEKLGHQKYSELLQECYRDLTGVVMKYEASIYQYVGDEVVMSWPYIEKQIKGSVRTFFDYENILTHKKETYLKKFGETPEFRGGMDIGAVTVSEVGDVKREIVYHGDVLNTASRLLEVCKNRNNRLVVSKEIGLSVMTENFNTSWREELNLRGKKEPVEAFSLSANGYSKA